MNVARRLLVVAVSCGALGGCSVDSPGGAAGGTGSGAEPRYAAGVAPAEPLVIGESFTIWSSVLKEARRVNVYTPTVYGESINGPLPVMYVLDGGLGEDFLHIAGLAQVLVSNGSMRPFLLVGIENTQRRRDMSGPTQNPDDRAMAPIVGGSDAFRRFLRAELFPAVRERYGTSGESAVIGESLAGLFVVETFVLDRAMFDTYVAVDPSLWWNNAELVHAASQRGRVLSPDADATEERGTEGSGERGGKSLFIATGGDSGMDEFADELAAGLGASAGARTRVVHVRFPEEKHATIFHPAALAAMRTVLAPRPPATSK